MRTASLPKPLLNDQNRETSFRTIITVRIHFFSQGVRTRSALAVSAVLFLVSFATPAGAEGRFASWARIQYDSLLASFSDFGSDYFGMAPKQQYFLSNDGVSKGEGLFQPASQMRISLLWESGETHRASGLNEVILLVRRTERSGKWSVTRDGLQVGPLQFGYGQLLADRSVVTQGWNGTAWEEPGCAFLRTNFAF